MTLRFERRGSPGDDAYNIYAPDGRWIGSMGSIGWAYDWCLSMLDVQRRSEIRSNAPAYMAAVVRNAMADAEAAFATSPLAQYYRAEG